MLSDPECVPRCRTLLSPQDFYSEQNQLIALAIFSTYDEGKKLDYVTVNTWLRDRELVQRVGGVGTLARLVDACPAVAHVETHALSVREKSRLRRFQVQLHTALAESYGDVGPDAQTWMDAKIEAMGAVARERAPERTITAGKAAAIAYENANEALKRGDAVTGFTTGMPQLDKITAGLNPGDLWLVSGKAKVKGVWKTTGAGKSALVVNSLCAGVAAAGGGVLLISMEDPREQLGQRLLAPVANVDSGRMRRVNELTMQDMSGMLVAVDTIAKWPMRIDDRKDMGATSIRARAYEVRDEFRRIGVPLVLIAIDNLQLVDWKQGLARWQQGKAGELGGVNQAQGLNEFGRHMLTLADELRCAVVVVTQLNAEGQVFQCPAFATHAKVWIETKREEVPEFDSSAPESAYLEIRKQRNGADNAVVPLWWYGRYVRFVEGDGYSQ